MSDTVEAAPPTVGGDMRLLPIQRHQSPESLDMLLARHRRERARNPHDYDAISAVMGGDGVHRHGELESLVIAYDGEVARLEAALLAAYKALDRGVSGMLIAKGVLRAALDGEPDG